MYLDNTYKYKYKYNVTEVLMDIIDSFLLECVVSIDEVNNDTKLKIKRVTSILKHTRTLILNELKQFREDVDLVYFDFDDELEEFFI